MLDRLLLDRGRVELMASNLRDVAALDDPVGTVIKSLDAPQTAWRCRGCARPIGVIGIVYEARPNVTTDTAALCIKAGNCIILRGGTEAIHSNRVLARLMSEAGTQGRHAGRRHPVHRDHRPRRRRRAAGPGGSDRPDHRPRAATG